MKRRSMRAGALVLMAAGLAAGAAGCTKKPAEAPPARAVRAQRAAPYSAGAQSRYTGALEPRAQVNLAFKVGGKVASLAQVEDRGIRRPIQEGSIVGTNGVFSVPASIRSLTDCTAGGAYRPREAKYKGSSEG